MVTVTAKLVLLGILQSTDVSSLGIDISTINQDEAMCLAQAVFFESKSEDIEGQYAVAHATLNRIKDLRFPRTICGVIRQASYSPKGIRLVCAYSWYCDESSGIIPVMKDGKIDYDIINAFKSSSLVAILVLSGKSDDNTSGATHFHNPKLCTPDWIHTMIRTIRIGHHDFYRDTQIFART